MSKNNKESFSIFFAISMATHCIILYCFLFSAFEVVNKLPEEKIITVDIVSVSNISNIKPSKITKEKTTEDLSKAHKVLNTHQEEPRKEPIQETPVEKTLNEKPLAMENIIEPLKQEILPKKSIAEDTKVEKDPIKKEILPKKPIVEDTKVEKDPIKKEILSKKPIVEDTKVEKAPIKKEILSKKKKEQVIQKNKKDEKGENELESLLKNLETASEGNNLKGDQVAQEKTDAKQNATGGYNENMPLSISEMQLIRGMIEKNWNVPRGIRNFKDIQITLYIKFNIDGSLDQLKLISKNCNGINANLCEALELSAFRAVHQASPFSGLRSDRHDAWKEIKLILIPSGE